jgi:hypothetical protein
MGHSHSRNHHSFRHPFRKFAGKINKKFNKFENQVKKTSHKIVKTIDHTSKDFVDAMNKLAKHPGLVSEKINLLLGHLDEKTMGVGSMIILAAVPEIALVDASSKAIQMISEGHSPTDAIITVGTSLLIAYALQKEINVLKISKNAFANKAIQQRFMNSKTGKMLIEKLKKKLPKQIANKI